MYMSSSCVVAGGLRGPRSEVTEAPRFISHLKDLKVMDGSRVRMTVELSGTTITCLCVCGISCQMSRDMVEMR